MRAESLARRAASLFVRHAGALHPDVASALDTVALARIERGDHAEALPPLRRALSILARYPRLQAVRPFTIQSLTHLTRALRELGRYAVARPLARRAIRLAGTLGDDGVMLLAHALNEHGMLCKYAGWFAAGARSYRRALALARGSVPSDPDLIADILHNQGGLEHARGRFAEAEPYAREGLALRVATHGDGHPLALLDAGALAATLSDLGEGDKAETLLRALLPRFEARYGASHYEVAVVCHNLAAVCAETGRHAEARSLYQRALRIKRARLGRAHPDIVVTLHNLAVTCDALGQTAVALRHRRAAHDIAQRTLGARHPTTRACREALTKRAS